MATVVRFLGLEPAPIAAPHFPRVLSNAAAIALASRFSTGMPRSISSPPRSTLQLPSSLNTAAGTRAELEGEVRLDRAS
jgi:hypothetical protein